ncbi:MAG TPA: hypothetical protein VGJ05_18095 [Fimbriiglobus sp.]|jgi:hypothetical protein
MRTTLCSILFLVFASQSTAQPPAFRDDPETKFGIPLLAGLYPQTSPKAALASTIKAIEKERYDYIVAQLMDEAFVETRIAGRSRDILSAVDADLRARREKQRLDPTVVRPADKLSMEPKAFAESVNTEARNRAFHLVVKDLKGKLGDDPEAIRELKRFAREGTVAESGDTATISLRDVKDRKMYLKKVDRRWFVENKQADDTAKPAK